MQAQRWNGRGAWRRRHEASASHPHPYTHTLLSRALASARAAHQRLPGKRTHWLAASLAAVIGTLTIVLAPGGAQATRAPIDPDSYTTVALSLPDTPIDTILDASLQDDGSAWQLVTVRPGETFGDIFARLGLPGATMHHLLQRDSLRERLTRIRPGEQFAFEIPAPGQLRALQFERDERSRVLLTLDGDRIHETVEAREIQTRIRTAGGEITQSLFAAGERAGLSNATILELAKVFGYDIDFAQDLRVGDRFTVVYEEVYRDGERLRGGDILAASFVNQGKRYSAYRYTFADGRVEYFDQDGRPMKKGFLRMPIDFARISSRFSSARRHPVLGTTRAHRGVDYAAATGTPIMAAGDGRISFIGTQRGYGRTVILDHGRGYTTLYAHMSRFGKHRNGGRVRQGDIIGYVGASGLATGPHLHYEFRIGGVHRDPLKVTLPKPEPLPRTELARFHSQTQPWLAQLSMLEGRLLASR